MADSLETEWQFDAADLDEVRAWLLAQPAHAPLTFDEVRDRTQVDTYFDTSDWRLYHAGFSLRRRRTADGDELTLKGLARVANGPISRREISEVLPVRPANGAEDEAPGDALDLGGQAGPVAERVRLIAGRRTIRPVVDVTTRRRTFAVWAGGPGRDRHGEGGSTPDDGRQVDRARIASVELDETTVAAPGGTPSWFQRVEIEMAGERATADVESFVRAMTEACELTPSSTSKYEMGLRAADLDPEATLRFGATEAAPEDGAEAYAYAWLRVQWAAFLRHEPGTRLGEDIEALHQMRVATRRLRAALHIFAPVLPDAFVRLRDELQWVGHELGAVRDLDVQIEELEQRRAAASWSDSSALAPLVQAIERERRGARQRLIELLNSTRYDALVDEMSHLLRAPALATIRGADASLFPSDTGDSRVTPGMDVRVFAAPVLDRRFRRLRRDIAALRAESPAEDYHRVRIRAKQLRYSVEIFGSFYGAPVQRFAVALKAVQDHLGEHQDADVGIARLQSLVASEGATLPPEALVAIGRLMEQYAWRMVVLRDGSSRLLVRLLRRWPPLHRRLLAVARDASPETPAEAASSVASPVASSVASPATSASVRAGIGGVPGTTDEGFNVGRDDASAAPRADVRPGQSRSQPPLPARPEDGGGTLLRMRQLFESD